MKININIEKKHFYFLIFFIILLSIGYVIASNWVSPTQGHDSLWVNNLYGKNTDTINVYDDLILKDTVENGIRTLQTSYIKTDKLTSTNTNPGSIVPIGIESNLEIPEGKNLKIGQSQGNPALTEIFPGQGIEVESGVGCPTCKKISATNFFGYELIEHSCGKGVLGCYAYCSAGKSIIGGGCRKGSSIGEIRINAPLHDKTGWQCVKSVQYSFLTAYSICADVSGSGPVTCTDICSLTNSPQCSGNDVQICASDGDSDPCLEWKTTTNCGGGICSNGQCRTNECTTSTCPDSTHVQSCGNYDLADSCLEKGDVTLCPGGGTCNGGICSLAN